MSPIIYQQIARDLDKCELIEAVGTPGMKKRAKSHRKACFQAVKKANEEEGLNTGQTARELLAELGAI